MTLRLADYARSRDNNFTLLRFMAAMMVVFAHSFSALGIPWFPDIFLDRFGRNIGEIALDMLFVTSGVLVTPSLVSRGLVEFLWARGLRLYPAMWLMLPVTVLLLAPLVTSLPVRDYYSSRTTWDYLWKCGTIVGGMRWSLPGVFETMPLKGEFNGSLWTLPVEARMYVYLVIGWIVFAAVPGIRLKALKLLALVFALVSGVLLVRANMTVGQPPPQDFAVFMFLYGSALYYWREKVPMGWGVAAVLAAAMALAAFDRTIAFVMYLLAMPLIFLHVAYLPGGFIRKFNDFGDYSYGIYIYAFPFQQTLAFVFPGISLIGEILGSAAASFGAAWVSWNVVEKRAMAMKHPCAAATERALAIGRARILSAVSPLPEGEGAGVRGPSGSVQGER